MGTWPPEAASGQSSQTVTGKRETRGDSSEGLYSYRNEPQTYSSWSPWTTSSNWDGRSEAVAPRREKGRGRTTVTSAPSSSSSPLLASRGHPERPSKAPLCCEPCSSAASAVLRRVEGSLAKSLTPDATSQRSSLGYGTCPGHTGQRCSQKNLEGASATSNTRMEQESKDRPGVSHSVAAINATVDKVARNYTQVNGHGCVPMKFYL